MKPALQAAPLLLLLQAGPALAYSVCVDPGHGGSAPGAVGCGLIEADINLDTALRLQPLLEAAGVQVLMTRETDADVSVSARASYANAAGVDRYVSLHCNSNTPPPGSGIETLCASTASSAAVALRDRIQEEMVAAWPLPDRGGKLRSDLYVLNHTSMPATLSEMAFINNCEVDASYLANPDERQRAAEAHRDAILAHLGVAAPEVGEAAGVVYRDLGDGGADTSQRLPGATVTVLEDGATAEAGPEAAAWHFELAPGAYTVQAELAGFRTARRSCQIAAGTTTWCSLGLAPAGDDDAGPGADSRLDAADRDAAADGGEGDRGDDAGAGDATGPEHGDQAHGDVIDVAIPPDCGCAAQRNAPLRQGLAPAFVLALLWRRRRRAGRSAGRRR